MHLIQTDNFETVKSKYTDVIENTPDIEKPHAGNMGSIRQMNR